MALVMSRPAPRVRLRHTQAAFLSLLQVNVIHTANPMEHASHMAAQPQFVHPEHRAFVDLSGHNLANPHPFAGKTVRRSPGLKEGWVDTPHPFLLRERPLLRAASGQSGSASQHHTRKLKHRWQRHP